MTIAALIKKYFPENWTIGCFARITDISLKTDSELKELRKTGYDGLTIGIETGDDKALKFMNKGYESLDILEQSIRSQNCIRKSGREIGRRKVKLKNIKS